MSNEGLITDALLKTAPNLYSMLDGSNDWKAALLKRGARVEKYRRYERGDHDSNLTEQQRRLMNIQEDDAELNESSSNYCGLVVDMMAGRLAVSEITAEDDTATDWITKTLHRNRFEAKEGEWYRGAIRDMESYVCVDPQTSLWTSEPAYDGFSGVVAIYDNMTMLPVWVCKLWVVSDDSDLSTDAGDKEDDAGTSVKIIVYQPEKITYWVGEPDSDSVSPMPIPPIPNFTMVEAGNGFEWKVGVIPIVQVANKRDNYTPYGESEIRVVIPLQNILNSTLYDMQMASKLSAFKVYWSIGMTIDNDGIMPGAVVNLLLKDKSGNIITEPTDGQIEFLKGVKVGEFGVTEMTQYTEQLDKLEREISQVSATPVYGITSQGNLSGEALKQLEIGLISKVYRFQRENTDAIILLLRITAEIQREFNVSQSFRSRFTDIARKLIGITDPTKPPSDLGLITVNWKSPEIIDTSVQITALSQLRRDNPGLWPDDWYRERVGAWLGMSQSQIKTEGEKAALQQSATLDAFLNTTGTPIV